MEKGDRTQVAFQGTSEVTKLVKLASAEGYAQLLGPYL